MSDITAQSLAPVPCLREGRGQLERPAVSRRQCWRLERRQGQPHAIEARWPNRGRRLYLAQFYRIRKSARPGARSFTLMNTRRWEIIVEWFNTSTERQFMETRVFMCGPEQAKNKARRLLADKHAEPNCIGECVRVDDWGTGETLITFELDQSIDKIVERAS